MSESASSVESPLVLRPQANLAAYACDLADRLTRYEQLDRSHGLPGEEYNPWTDLIARHPFYDEAATLAADPLWHCDRVVLSDAENSLMVVHDKLTNQWIPHQGRIEGPSREQAIAVLLLRSQARAGGPEASRTVSLALLSRRSQERLPGPGQDLLPDPLEGVPVGPGEGHPGPGPALDEQLSSPIPNRLQPGGNRCP